MTPPSLPGAGVSGLGVSGLGVERDGREVLRGVSFEVAAGGWLAVIGPNGAGKSTLLQAVAGLLPYGGDVRAGGARVAALRGRARARRIAYAPQTPVLPPDMTVLAYVLLGRSPYIPYLGRETAADRAIAFDVLERLDLAAFSSRRLGHLSGGERQRVVLARALAQQAPVLLLDEPTSALDLGHQQRALELVDRLRLDDGLTVITTLHDLTLAAQYADDLLLLSAGAVAARGPAAKVLTEDLLATHFAASVTILHDPAGRPILSPRRPKGA